MLCAISLFSGIGGIDIAFAGAGFNIIAQVEIDGFCRRVLAKHGRYWPNAKQFADVRQFGRADIAIDIDIIFGGFPCQPHSKSGKRQGAADSRDMWPEFRRVIGDIRPRCVFLENVPGITTTIGAGVTADLAALGYMGRWGIVSAADAGAAHIRERWWVVAYSNSEWELQQGRGKPNVRGWAYNSGSPVGNATSQRSQESEGVRRGFCEERSTAERAGVETGRRGISQSRLGGAADGVPGWLAEYRRPALQGQAQYDFEPPRTTAEKGADHADKLRALGNAVFVPTVYAFAVAIREALVAEEITESLEGKK
jgi:DNA (cytosine-5)-methyltransferase 1